MMKKNILMIWAALLLTLITTLACQVSFRGFDRERITGSREVVVVDRPVGSFSRIDLGAIGHMQVEFGEDTTLRIEAEDNVMQYIKSEVLGDTLRIYFEKGINLIPTKSIRYFVTLPQLEEVAISGAGDINIPEAENYVFFIQISGAGNVTLESLSAEDLEVEMSGLGNVTIRGGQVGTQQVGISGSGNFDAHEMQSEEAVINLSGLGSASVWATSSLEVEISGAGSVQYVGDPIVQSDISGLGTLKKIGE